jgi:capsular exopolysaccharide synthesis family protein
LVLSFLVVFAFEYWSNTIDDVDDLVQASGAPILGAIAPHKKLRGNLGERLAVQALPKSAAAENYRMLGTKLLHASDFRDLKSVLISTADPNSNTGELVANLAIVLSQTGSRVVLVDANLHHPTIGQIFDLNDRTGLTDVLTNQAETIELTSIDWAPGLSVLPSGPISFDSFALLASPRMTAVLSRLEKMSDIVIVVASSVLYFADSLFLTTHVDGVILAARRAKTQTDMVQNAASSLRLVGASLMGMVLLDSREKNAKITTSGGRFSVARQALGQSYRANGHKRVPFTSPQLAADSSQEPTVPTNPAKIPDKL